MTQKFDTREQAAAREISAASSIAMRLVKDSAAYVGSLPATLPENTLGWTRKLRIQMNFGRKAHIATYSVFDDKGIEMPFQYGYNTGTDESGFTLANYAAFMSWQELRRVWPEYLAAQAGKKVGAGETATDLEEVDHVVS